MPATLCRKCGFNNPPGMRFCGNCGSRLGATGMLEPAPMAVPPDLKNLSEQVGVMMGADLLERFRQAGLEAAGQRRTVTLLFADLSGFTGLSQRLDTEELFLLIQQFAGLLARSVYKYEGMVDKFIGDGLMAIFGAPIAQENSAEMAARAALDMQVELARFSQEVQDRYHNEQLHLHIGLHTGTVIVGSMGSSMMMNYTAIGDTVNLAARLQQNADPDAILVSQAVYQFTRPLFDYENLPLLNLKGYPRPIPAFRLVGPRQVPGSVRGLTGLSAPLIGREAELNALCAAADQVVHFKNGQIALIEGDAGIGKSRLTAELRAYLKPLAVRVLIGQSYTYRRTVPYWVFQDLLRGLFGLHQNTTEALALSTTKDHLVRLLGPAAADTLPYIYYMLSIGLDRPEVTERTRYLDAAQLRQRIFLAVRTVLVAEARQAPLALIFEDLHWADESSIDLLVYLFDAIADNGLLCLGISRHYSEMGLDRLLQKAKRDLASRCLHLHLVQLTPAQSQDLLTRLLSIPELPAELHEKIISSAAGNPFYLEEILRMLIDERKIYFEGNRWRLSADAAIESLGVPDTLQGLILARFDRLEPINRRTLQIASVIGRNFSSGVLGVVLKQEEVDLQLLPQALNELEQRGFVLPQAGLSDFDFQFKHVIVSDAIYSTLLKAERGDLHSRVGESIEALYPDRISELVELLARHYSWSNNLGRALHYLLLAGQKEARNYANQQARQSFEQAIEVLDLIDHTHGQEIDAHSGLGDVLVFTGEYPAAQQQFQLALQAMDALEAPEYALQRSALLRKLSSAYERQGNYDQALAELDSAQAALEAAPKANPVEQAWILNSAGWIHFRRGDMETATENLQKALDLVANSGAYDLIASIYNRLGGVAYQQGRLEQASDFSRRSLELRQRIGDVNAVARSYNNLGLLSWRRGDWEGALDSLKRSVELHSSLGDAEGAIEISNNLGLVYLDLRDFDHAFEQFNQALAAARKIGHSYHIGLSLLHLARASIFRQDWSKALEYAALSRQSFAEIGVQEHEVYIHIYTGQAYLGQGRLQAAHQAAQIGLANLSNPNTPSEERAHAQRLWSQVLKAELGESHEVETALRISIEDFQAVDNQLEAARSQLLLADALAAFGKFAAAQVMRASARKIFERLGLPPE